MNSGETVNYLEIKPRNHSIYHIILGDYNFHHPEKQTSTFITVMLFLTVCFGVPGMVTFMVNGTLTQRAISGPTA